LLRMIAGLESITEGELRIDGQLMNHVPPAQRRVAMVFQNYALYPHMSVYENMAFGLRQAKIDKATIDSKVRRTAAAL
jgi:multiple sugar transport system ATP-binding protein